MTRADRRSIPDAETVATDVHRLAVLLQAGLTPARAWGEITASTAPVGGMAGPIDDTAIAEKVIDGAGIAEACRRRGGVWAEVGIAWRVATTVGAPLAPSLRTVAETLRDAEQARHDVAVALAEPAVTARLIAWLPLLAIVLVAAFGFDVAGALSSPLGLAGAGGGIALMVVARRWTASLVRRAQPPDGIAGWSHELVTIALSGGVSIDRALAVVEDAGCADARDATASVLALSRRCGAPAVELLQAEAADRRRATRTEGRLRAAKLSGRLLLPLGVCTLPAFLLLGVAPMLLSVLSSAPVVF